ncbi:MAG: dockerin type I repeat-containing protein, partial [Clostridia bacterium]|nr:dockerin type I repeat-containing protein [Clostridia bacterium]
DGSSEELSVEPSEEPSEEPIVAPAEGVVIYDATVSKTLTLAPGKRLSNADITAALQAETAAHGIAERYIVTVNGDANQTDSVYPILLGNGVEAWPSSNYDHHYKIGQSGITYGSVLGSKFTAATPPTDLYFYADTNPTTLNIDHITIRAVRKDDTVIYDSDVSETLTLAPGKRLSNADITAALQAETAAHGIAQQYIVTVTADATPAGSVYPILLGSSGAEVWPNGAGDSYHAGAGATIIGTLAGFGFTNASDVPQALFFYAENGNTTLNIRHITIQVVRGEGSVEESTEPSGDPSDGSGGTLSEDVSEAPLAESNEDSSEKPSTEPPAQTSEESSDERSEDEILYGDVDKDGEITMKDVLKLRKFIAGMIADMDRAADVNRDGSVDMKDVLLMRRLIALR